MYHFGNDYYERTENALLYTFYRRQMKRVFKICLLRHVSKVASPSSGLSNFLKRVRTGWTECKLRNVHLIYFYTRRPFFNVILTAILRIKKTSIVQLLPWTPMTAATNMSDCIHNSRTWSFIKSSISYKQSFTVLKGIWVGCLYDVPLCRVHFQEWPLVSHWRNEWEKIEWVIYHVSNRALIRNGKFIYSK